MRAPQRVRVLPVVSRFGARIWCARRVRFAAFGDVMRSRLNRALTSTWMRFLVLDLFDVAGAAGNYSQSTGFVHISHHRAPYGFYTAVCTLHFGVSQDFT
eukprot:332978-Prymnesium_polylepis.1